MVCCFCLFLKKFLVILLLCIPLIEVYAQSDSVAAFVTPEYHVGDIVLIRKETKKYLTGETPSRWFYFVKHSIMRVGSPRFPEGILLRGIISWVGKDDIILVESTDSASMSEQVVAEQKKQMEELVKEIEQLSESEKTALARLCCCYQYKNGYGAGC